MGDHATHVNLQNNPYDDNGLPTGKKDRFISFIGIGRAEATTDITVDGHHQKREPLSPLGYDDQKALSKRSWIKSGRTFYPTVLENQHSAGCVYLIHFI